MDLFAHIAAVPSLAAAAVCASTAFAAPVATPFVLPGDNDTACVAAGAMAGVWAAGDSFQNRVSIFQHDGTLLFEITPAQIAALCPWMVLDGGPDGPSALAFSSTGKQLFISIHDDTLPGDGLPSDAILRYDQATNALTLFSRLELFDRGDLFPHLASAHWRAVLYAGNDAGQIKAILANANAASGSNTLATWTLPTPGPIRGVAIDRDTSTIFVSNGTQIYRAPLTNTFTTPPAWTLIATSSNVRGLSWGDAYGGTIQRGLFILSGATPTDSRIEYIFGSNAYLASPTTPIPYAASPGPFWHGLSHRGDGALFVGADEDASLYRDNAESSLAFAGWRADEFAQHVAFARGLISPDGEPAGWVIDADTIPTLARFHPATPDAAAWTVLMLTASKHVNNDANAQAQVRTILTRYAGLASDGIAPDRTADGVFRHWIDPLTGGVKSGWDPEFATLSTMKIVLAASRAMDFFPDDPAIAKAGSRIIFRTRNWDSYFFPANGFALAFKALQAGGADAGTFARPFHEGVLFVEEAAAYGGVTSDNAWAYWLNRANHPTASYSAGFPVSSTGNYFEPAFISLYPALLSPAYRASSGWQSQVKNIRWNHNAWTDDWGPRFSTVFSAGTTRGDWGGYHADSITSHPGDVTTFTSLIGLSALGDADPLLGAYHAYRRGARQTFRTGASLLYRRSDLDRNYLPDSAGLPDVSLAGLALAESLLPGTIDAVLARAPTPRELSPTDLTGEGQINLDDLYAIVQAPADINGDGAANAGDIAAQANWLRRHERRQVQRQP